jgi:hypothetical protein
MCRTDGYASWVASTCHASTFRLVEDCPSREELFVRHRALWASRRSDEVRVDIREGHDVPWPAILTSISGRFEVDMITKSATPIEAGCGLL